MAGTTTRIALSLACAAGLVAGVPGAGAAQLESASGHGTLDDGARQFSFNAKRHADGTVSGQAQLINTAGEDKPYRLHIDISCMNTIGNTAILGGTTKSTSDPDLVDAVFFTVQDNGEPGQGADKISRAYFWDGDPTTTGDPQACMLTEKDAFDLEPIEGGNIQVRPVGTS